MTGADVGHVLFQLHNALVVIEVDLGVETLRRLGLLPLQGGQFPTAQIGHFGRRVLRQLQRPGDVGVVEQNGPVTARLERNVTSVGHVQLQVTVLGADPRPEKKWFIHSTLINEQKGEGLFIPNSVYGFYILKKISWIYWIFSGFSGFFRFFRIFLNFLPDFFWVYEEGFMNKQGFFRFFGFFGFFFEIFSGLFWVYEEFMIEKEFFRFFEFLNFSDFFRFFWDFSEFSKIFVGVRGFYISKRI